MIALVVIVEYSSDSVRYRTASELALLGGDSMPNGPVDVEIARAKLIGHVIGFAASALTHVHASSVF